MNPLCRHILPAGRHCTQPAVRTALYCRHHQVIKRALAKVEPKPDPYGIYTPLPFVFPEDRAALQINFMLVAQALNDRSIHIQMANAFNRIFRSCEINLSRGPLTEIAPEKPQKQARRNPNEKWLTDDEDSEPQRNPHGEMVQRVILTPGGEEIAPLREVLEEDEAPLTHGKECPCHVCAEQYRGAKPEEHHVDCKCGLCEQITDLQPATTAQDKIELPSPPKQSEVEGPAFLQASQEFLPTENDCSPTKSSRESAAPVTSLPAPPPVGRSVMARKFQQTAPVNQQPSLKEVVFGDQIKQYEAEQAGFARAAREAGLEPPPHKPWDNTMYKSEAERRYEEHREQIRRNQQAAREAWIARFPDIPPEEPCLSWGEEHDRKLAAMREGADSNSPEISVPA